MFYPSLPLPTPSLPPFLSSPTDGSIIAPHRRDGGDWVAVAVAVELQAEAAQERLQLLAGALLRLELQGLPS